jgi:hypothetical protein
MAKILMLDKDDTNLKLMKEALGLTGQEDEGASFQSEDVHCFVIPEPLKPEEIPKGKTPDPMEHIYRALNTKPFDFIFMEANQIGNHPEKFPEEFRKKITLEQNKNIPIVLLSYNDDIDYIRKVVISGVFHDMLLKPADAPHFRQRFSLLVSKNGTYKKELYTMPTLQPVNVAYNFLIEDISEFGLILKSSRPYKTTEFVTFYSPVFKTDKKAEVIGRCYKSDKIGNTEEYQSYFVFVGVGDTMRKQIRTWMKQEYVRKKQAA